MACGTGAGTLAAVLTLTTAALAAEPGDALVPVGEAVAISAVSAFRPKTVLTERNVSASVSSRADRPFSSDMEGRCRKAASAPANGIRVKRLSGLNAYPACTTAVPETCVQSDSAVRA